jgi:hypothetical protein
MRITQLFTISTMLFFAGLSGFVHSAPAATAQVFTRDRIFNTLNTTGALDSASRVVGFYHVCDLALNGKRLAVVFVKEVVTNAVGQPERGVNSTFVFNSTMNTFSKIEGQANAPLSCQDNILIFPTNLIGLALEGEGNAIIFSGNSNSKGVLATPLRIQSLPSLPSVKRVGKAIQ